VRHPLRIVSAVFASLLVASPVARAHEWYPLACCGGEDCGPADIVVYAGETDWEFSNGPARRVHEMAWLSASICPV
jgi:hypothetical protein